MTDNKKQMLSTAEAAERLGISKSRIIQLLKEGRIRGAVQLGGHANAPWMIPADFVVPPGKRGPKPKAGRG